MSRFKTDYRHCFGNKIAAHYDKYAQIANPVEFDVLEDVYRPAFSRKEWASVNRLMETKLGKECLSRGSTFDLYLPGQPGQRKWERKHVTFGMPGKKKPPLDIEYADLAPAIQAKLDAWLKKATGLKELRQDLWHRCDRLLDFGWDKYKGQDQHGCWRGGPTPGQGCNTPGQLYRLWPELLPFTGQDQTHIVRNASVKSPLPKYIVDYGTPAQFRCESPLFHDADSRGEGSNPYTEEEMVFEKRKFEALSHILTQMSLLLEVDHIKGYPTVC